MNTGVLMSFTRNYLPMSCSPGFLLYMAGVIHGCVWLTDALSLRM